MAAEDYLNYDYDDEFDEGVTCKYCGLQNLWWNKTISGWRLFDWDGKLHKCLIKKREKNEKRNG